MVAGADPAEGFLIVIGQTTDGVRVCDEVFMLYDTIGVPLSVIFEMMRERNMIPSWMHFFEDARKHGWKYDTILSRIREGLVDSSYGAEFADEVINRLKSIYKPPEKQQKTQRIFV